MNDDDEGRDDPELTPEVIMSDEEGTVAEVEGVALGFLSYNFVLKGSVRSDLEFVNGGRLEVGMPDVMLVKTEDVFPLRVC